MSAKMLLGVSFPLKASSETAKHLASAFSVSLCINECCWLPAPHTALINNAGEMQGQIEPFLSDFSAYQFIS